MKTAGVIAFLSATVVSLIVWGHAFSSRTLRPIPQTVLWAWERPEDLGFLDPEKVGVAFLACSIDVAGAQIAVQPRMQPLKIPPGTILLAVVRLTTSHRDPPTYSVQERGKVVDEILRGATIPGIAGIQIDFDAVKSQRRFYRSLLEEVRRRLPDSLSLTMTALTSWCLDDPWIKGLPVDDAIPMLFRLGPDRETIRQELAEGRDFSSPVCRQSIGVSLDEPIPRVFLHRRIYLFNPQPWTPESFASFRKEFAR